MKQLVLCGVMLVALCLSANVYAQETQTQPQTQPQTQSQTQPQTDETNFETQLFLLVGTNQDVAEPRIPSSLDGIMKQLRATLPFKNYRLATTLINRVKNEGRLDVNSISG